MTAPTTGSPNPSRPSHSTCATRSGSIGGRPELPGRRGIGVAPVILCPAIVDHELDRDQVVGQRRLGHLTSSVRFRRARLPVRRVGQPVGRAGDVDGLGEVLVLAVDRRAALLLAAVRERLSVRAEPRPPRTVRVRQTASCSPTATGAGSGRGTARLRARRAARAPCARRR